MFLCLSLCFVCVFPRKATIHYGDKGLKKCIIIINLVWDCGWQLRLSSETDRGAQCLTPLPGNSQPFHRYLGNVCNYRLVNGFSPHFFYAWKSTKALFEFTLWFMFSFLFSSPKVALYLFFQQLYFSSPSAHGQKTQFAYHEDDLFIWIRVHPECVCDLFSLLFFFFVIVSLKS